MRNWIVAVLALGPMLLAASLAASADAPEPEYPVPIGTAAPMTAAPATAAPATAAPAVAADIAALRAEITSLSSALAETRDGLERARFEPSGPTLAVSLMAEGKRVYDRACASCHGRSGDGKGPAAKYLNPPARDFTMGEYKFRSTPSGTMPTDDDIARTIIEGVNGTSMPAWRRKLSPHQVRAVIIYIKAFAEAFADEEIDPEEILVVPATAPAATPATINEGEQIYKLFKCWDCHGTDGKGGGPSAKTLKDSKDRKIAAYNFTTGMYKGGRSSTAIYRTFNTGMDGTPMPSYADVLVYGREAGADLSEIVRVYGEAETAELASYLAGEPTTATIGGMEEAALQTLIERRRWALVHFMESLTRKRNAFDYLFRDKPGRYDVAF